MSDPWFAHFLFALAWVGFGVAHSVTASAKLKRALNPWLGHGYRLAYNGFSVLSLGLVWLLGQSLFPTPRPLITSDSISFSMYAVSLIGLLGAIWAARHYDLSRFSGTAQWRHRTEERFAEDEPLREDGLHRYIRHPIYAFCFPLIWGLAQDERALATAIWISVYLIIGSKMEEQRLIDLYGAAYERYRRRVPAFIPFLK